MTVGHDFDHALLVGIIPKVGIIPFGRYNTSLNTEVTALPYTIVLIYSFERKSCYLNMQMKNHTKFQKPL
jgi:hypothetical protein